MEAGEALTDVGIEPTVEVGLISRRAAELLSGVSGPQVESSQSYRRYDIDTMVERMTEQAVGPTFPGQKLLSTFGSPQRMNVLVQSRAEGNAVVGR